MGKLKKLEKLKLSEEKIQNILVNNFMSQSNIKFVAENLFIYKWESDLWFMTKSDITYEIEIKVTKADYKNDTKKQEKHIILENHNEDYKPNYFYYAVPENMIEENDIPDYAGLIYITEIFPYFKIIKTAPLLTSKKINEEQLNLLEKFYYNYRNWKTKTMTAFDTIKTLNEIIDKYQRKPNHEKKSYTKLLEENKNLKNKLQIRIEKSNKEKNLIDEIHCQRHIIRELELILKNNNIPYDISKIEDEYYE